MSELALKLIAEAKKTNARKLDLGKCNLWELPEELFELEGLEELYLCNRYWRSEQKKWIESPNQEAFNRFVSVPQKINRLKSLRILFCNGAYDTSLWDVTDFSFLKDLSQLRSLDLSSNRISDTSFLKNLSQLKSLWLSSNHISDISFLKNLSQLRVLDLSGNQIKDFSFLKNLSQLQSLGLRSNHISDISFIEGLIQLQSLDLRSNQITDISFLKDLSQLHFLFLRDNQIIDISFLKDLLQLQSLNLGYNKISDLKPALPLIESGIEVKLEGHGDAILLGNNPIKYPPPEIIKRGNKAVINYFEESEKQGIDFLYEAKLLIVGKGSVGKTTLARRLISPIAPMPKEKETTKGIEIKQLGFTSQDNKDFVINIWDFGGQEIYHATHQFFLTKRSLYILVDDTKDDDKTINDASFNYWMQTVQLFGNNSPLLIVQNEKADRSKDIDLIGMKSQFPFIVESIPTNLKTPRGLRQVHKAIQTQIQLLPHIGQALPKQWLVIRNELSKIEKERPYINIQEYFQICADNRIYEEQRALELSNYLHDLGSFLHFNKDLVLKRTIILQNEWATDAVYKVLDDETVKSNKGKFGINEIVRIWKDSSFKDMQVELLALMRNFELCYPLPDENEESYLIPQLLSESRPKNYSWDSENNLHLKYKYGFMPKGILSRLIVKMNTYVKDLRKAWKKGVVMEKENSFAEIIETYGKNEIHIRVRGDYRKDLMTLIDAEFDKIHDPILEQLEFTKLIPCNCSECKKNKEPYFFKYEDLKKRKTKGRPHIECNQSLEKVKVLSLIDDVFVEYKDWDLIDDKLEFMDQRLNDIQNNTSSTKELLSFYLTNSSKIEFPYLFTLKPPSYELAKNQSLTSTKYELQFYCMHPEEIHAIGKAISINVSKEWIAKIAPYYNPMLKMLKGLSHFVLPGAFNLLGPEDYGDIKPNLEGARDTLKSQKTIGKGGPLRQYKREEASEAYMELLKGALQKHDPKNTWKNDLQKVVKHGKVIWVCGEHV